MDTPRTMITFKQDATRFTYRVAAIAMHNDAVLFEQAPDKSFWNLPGGRAEMGETAAESLAREMREELGTEITVVRLLYVVEHFFSHKDVAHHTLGLYFLVTFPDDSYLYRQTEPFTRVEDDLQLTFAWLPITDFERFTISPEFLREGLQALPGQTTHMIYSDE